MTIEQISRSAETNAHNAHKFDWQLFVALYIPFHFVKL
jgi:hypothetical protein